MPEAPDAPTRLQSGDCFADDRKQQFRLELQALVKNLTGDFDCGGEQLIGNLLIQLRDRLLQAVHNFTSIGQDGMGIGDSSA